MLKFLLPVADLGQAVARLDADQQIAGGDAGAEAIVPAQAGVAPAGTLALGLVFHDGLADPGVEASAEADHEHEIVGGDGAAMLKEGLELARPALGADRRRIELVDIVGVVGGVADIDLIYPTGEAVEAGVGDGDHLRLRHH